MSGQNPSSWNHHHPMPQVSTTSFVPRPYNAENPLPLTHLPPDRVSAEPWANMVHGPLALDRHGLAPAPDYDYDKQHAMMDLSISSTINIPQEDYCQDYSSRSKSNPISQLVLMGSALPNGSNQDKSGNAYSKGELVGLQNPMGVLPLMVEPMQLVKEALLKSIAQTQVPSLSVPCIPPNDSCGRFGNTMELDAENINSSSDVKMADPSVAKEHSRRKTRKPNKTTKVDNSLNRTQCEGESDNQDEEMDVQSPPPKKVATAAVALDAGQLSITDGNGQDATDKGREDENVSELPKKRVKNRTDTPENLDEKPKTAPNGQIADPKSAVDADTSFEEVENKLTEMFAGITDTASPTKTLNDVPTTSSAATVALPSRRTSTCIRLLVDEAALETDSDDEEFSLAPQQKKPRSRPQPKKKNGAGQSGGGGNSKKKKAGGGKTKGSKNNKRLEEFATPQQGSKKAAKEAEGERFRGPLLQVRRDGSLMVLNNALGQAEDEQETRNGIKVKKFLHNGGAAIRGLHASTLSMKYDTDRTDTSWVCVFCKLGPHKMGLGDLFGPYMTTIDCDEFRRLGTCDMLQSARTKLDMVQTAPHRLPAVQSTVNVSVKGAVGVAAVLKSPTGNKTGVPAKRGPKKKQRPSADASGAVADASSSACPAEGDLFCGLTRATDNAYEIWMHEDCIVWASGVYMIAGRLVGLEEAVWSSTGSRCVLCKKGGAGVCCLQRSCTERVHVACGRQSNWLLDEVLLHSYCQKHHEGGGSLPAGSQLQVSVAANDKH